MAQKFRIHFLAEGKASRLAGEAEISSAQGSAPFGVSINNYSGHFEPSAENMQIGIDAFANADITFAMEDPYVGE